MTLKLKNIKNFIRFVKKKEITKVKIKNYETSIIINKIKREYYTYNTSKFYDSSEINSYYNNLKNKEPLKKSLLSNNLINKCVPKTKEKIEKPAFYSMIVSPMVGNFYRSPAPNERSFIEKNDIVKPKQTVCIIEAMKLMNEIEAEVNGEIVEILVNDGDVVDCGQALMKVKIKKDLNYC
uniref:Biotin carboxyl carrier protein of acetyl-CoA carboxylase n=1 Tax=Bostrychia simpliciuscula TaxID=324754 RepID=A0A1Z1M887_9FLOR|nr:acetyl-CoA carboxylase biotin carboxyl carrier protein [Bostrychia simpliciuscula]ARW62112.1 acetyl-CoA carboxylase biotin carboxyl carrier protein [Bostrychia simpliciuscula]